jgi:SAM-dependent methyltransferase
MSYVHGYDRRANVRLQDQADALVDLLHSDTHYPERSLVLEAGCGVGAQTVTLVRNSPRARFVSIDISPDSLGAARRKVQSANVLFQQADVYQLPFARESFDHVFVCFLLEHLARPLDALEKLKQVLKPGGSITVIEGDHGSTYFHPDSAAAHEAIRCQVELQRASGGNANIGRELYPLLRQARFADVSVSPRMVYVDASRPRLVDGFTRKTFTAMIEGVREAAVRAAMISAARFDEGIRALYRTAEDDGVFCYTFFKALGRKSSL